MKSKQYKVVFWLYKLKNTKNKGLTIYDDDILQS